MATQFASPLRLRMHQLMKVRNFSPRTIEIYLGAVAKFAKFFGRSPDKLGAGRSSSTNSTSATSGTSRSRSSTR